MKNQQTYPSELTDEQWQLIKDLIPAAKKGGRPRRLAMRSVLNAILYVVVGGVQWRMLPKEYPNWKSVYHYFRKWRDQGVWERLHGHLRATLRQKVGRHKHPSAGSMDAQSVKASEWSGERGFDAGKKVNGRKRHLLVDTLGLVLAVVVTTADVQDQDGARSLLRRGRRAGKKLRLIWVDGGYRGQLVRWVSRRFRFRLQPVLRTDDRRGFVVLPRRWVVERTFAWLAQYRRLSKDYERLTPTAEAMIHIAMIRLMLRRLA